MSTARYLVLVVCAVMATIAMHGCAPTTAYITARNVETMASKFVDTGADAWHAYSHAQLENYKNACGDLACFKTASAQWEAGTVAQADKAIDTAKKAVQTFDEALNATNAVKQNDFSAAISALMSAISQLVSILNGYGLSLTMLKLSLAMTTVL